MKIFYLRIGRTVLLGALKYFDGNSFSERFDMNEPRVPENP
jgi:hypothetical protein